MTEVHLYDFYGGHWGHRCVCHDRIISLPIEEMAGRVWRRVNALRSWLPRERAAMRAECK